MKINEMRCKRSNNNVDEKIQATVENSKANVVERVSVCVPHLFIFVVAPFKTYSLS